MIGFLPTIKIQVNQNFLYRIRFSVRIFYFRDDTRSMSTKIQLMNDNRFFKKLKVEHTIYTMIDVYSKKKIYHYASLLLTITLLKTLKNPNNFLLIFGCKVSMLKIKSIHKERKITLIRYNKSKSFHFQSINFIVEDFKKVIFYYLFSSYIHCVLHRISIFQ